MIPLPELPGVEHRRVEVDGLSFHVAEAGSGPPLVLLHGWPQHWWSWRRVVPGLAPRYRLVMIDLRGHGWSDAPGSGYDKEQLATDVLGVADRLALDRFGLVGHDWGGWVGFLLALRAPERLDGLLALSIVPPFQRPDPGKVALAWRGAYQVALSTPVVAEQVLRRVPQAVEAAFTGATSVPRTFSAEDRRTYSAVLQEPARAHASSLLYRTFLTKELPQLHRYRDQRLTVPTRLVVGADDPVARPALLRDWREHADDMRVDRVPGAGHFLPEEVPERVVLAVDELFGT